MGWDRHAIPIFAGQTARWTFQKAGPEKLLLFKIKQLAGVFIQDLARGPGNVGLRSAVVAGVLRQDLHQCLQVVKGAVSDFIRNCTCVTAVHDF